MSPCSDANLLKLFLHPLDYLRWEMVAPGQAPDRCASEGRVGTCNQVITSPATIQAPETHRQCPGGTHQSGDHPEVNTNPDIRVGSALLGVEKAKTEAGGAGDSKEQEESRSANRNQQNQGDERGKEQNKDLGVETPIRPKRLDQWTRHVPGGVWLSQVQSFLRLSYVPLWGRNGSEGGIAGKGQEERDHESE
ncbi:hypothetical protein NDU88_001861 [Pleurodeles waltl]|uniref:Uncharacterized protein n=1 Tax=Pleurodeles waltl TaxID=8319 RepID=A0AAV7W179_PLEWA|nr:hypothetical protein NDU88_001861 [Pleurodeles waltl]